MTWARSLLSAVVLLAGVGTTSVTASAGVYDIQDVGAKPDGQTLCTEAIQKTVDLCAKAGGGTVYFPPGRWLTGTVYLADNVTIELENGCTVLGTTDKSQYGQPRQLMGMEGEQYSTWAIFAGKGLQSIAIRGRGVIDGQGSHFKYKNGARPKNLYFEDCRDVLIESVRLRNAGSWMQHYRNCDRLTIRDIAVFNHVSYNNDGLNIDSYPESTMFGTLPAYGLFCRHVKGLRLQNIRLQTSTPDRRHAVVLDDAKDIVIDSLDAPRAEGAATVVRLRDTSGVVIRNSDPPGKTNDR